MFNKNNVILDDEMACKLNRIMGYRDASTSILSLIRNIETIEANSTDGIVNFENSMHELQTNVLSDIEKSFINDTTDPDLFQEFDDSFALGLLSFLKNDPSLVVSCLGGVFHGNTIDEFFEYAQMLRRSTRDLKVSKLIHLESEDAYTFLICGASSLDSDTIRFTTQLSNPSYEDDNGGFASGKESYDAIDEMIDNLNESEYMTEHVGSGDPEMEALFDEFEDTLSNGAPLNLKDVTESENKGVVTPVKKSKVEVDDE